MIREETKFGTLLITIILLLTEPLILNKPVMACVI